jgi:hypothetical protein
MIVWDAGMIGYLPYSAIGFLQPRQFWLAASILELSLIWTLCTAVRCERYTINMRLLKEYERFK